MRLSLFSLRRVPRISRGVGILTLCLALAGCGGSIAYREGNALLAEGKTEEGIAKLEEAVKLEPNNAEYRIALTGLRVSRINNYISAGDAARRGGQLSEAEKTYRQVLELDPRNTMARQGLESIVKERQHQQVIAEAEALFKNGEAVEALEKLRTVLSENPGQKEAVNLKARLDEFVAKSQRPETQLAAAFRKPISLEFRDAPLKSVLEVIAKISGLNFFYDKEIRPDLKATIFVKNTTIEDAMRLLLVTNQLEQKILNENSVLIYPNTPQKLKEYQTLVVRTFYLINADVKAVSNSIKTIVKTKDLVIDERLGIIIMRDTPEAVRMAERIVNLQDMSEPEVMLEVEILEVKRSRLMQLGVQWPSQLALTPLGSSSTGLTLNDLKNLSSSRIQASIGNMNLNAYKEDQDANILANPRIRVRNKEKAKIQIGDRVPVVTTTSTSTGFVSESVNYLDVGLKLEVEPSIYLDDEVAIKVNLEVSNLVREIISKAGTLSYQIGTRNADTVLRLKNGETQILAGLISDEDRSSANKVPGLGELPIAGRLFGSQKDDSQRSEILLSITPRIVRSIKRPDLLAAEFESGTESNIGSQALRLSTAVPPVAQENKGASLQPGLVIPPGLAADVPGTTAGGLPPTTAPVSTSAPAQIGGEDMAAPIGAPPVVSPVAPPPSAAPPVSKAAPVSTAPVPSTPVTGGSVVFSWQAPAQIRAGEQFSAVLKVNTPQDLQSMPLLVAFDPKVLQVVNVHEGDFFKQGGGQTQFSQRVDPVQGKVFMALMRQGGGQGVNGMGSLVTVTFKALKTEPATRINLLSASPEPASAVPARIPLEHVIKVVH